MILRVQSAELRVKIGLPGDDDMGVGKDKSKAFAIRIVRLCRYLREEKKEYVLSEQLLRSGTSIGANLAEAENSFSRKEFLAKVYIALKETSETKFWLELLYNTDYLTKRQFESVISDEEELSKILTSTTKTMRNESTLI